MVSRKPGGRGGEQSRMLFLGKNYTQIRTALHKIAFSRIKTSVLKKKPNGVFTNSFLCCTQLPGVKATHES